MKYQRKGKPANWVSAFPKQAKALHPDQTASKTTEADKKAVWHEIRDLMLVVHPVCFACELIWPDKTHTPHVAVEVHHRKGRNGILLFDPRHMTTLCRQAHEWIHNNPETAYKIGLMEKRNVA